MGKLIHYMGIYNGDIIEIRWKHDEYANWFHCFVYEPGPKCCLEMSGPALSLLVGSSIPNILHTQYLPGWWYTYPSETYESQLGWLFPIYGKLKMLQTTDQLHIWKIGEHHFMFVLTVKHLKTYELPSKSIVYAWYKNISYRSLGGGPIAFQCFVQINTKYFKNARELASRIQL